MSNLTKTALTIAGSDSSGGAGIQADLKTFSALGVHGTCIITAVTAQNTRKIHDIFELPIRMIEQQFAAILDDFHVSFAKSGMLYSKEIIELVSKKIEEYGFKLILDPIIFAGTGIRLLKEDAENSLMKDLFPKTHLITPNLTEASRIIGEKIKSVEEMKEIARKIKKLGPDAVLIKGGHLEGQSIADVLYFEDKFTIFEKAKTKQVMHGTGCILSAAITAFLTLNHSLTDSVARAEAFMDLAIQHPIITKSGIYPVNPLAQIELDASRFKVIENLNLAIKKIEGEKKFSRIIPEVRTNIAMSIPNAGSTDEVATTEGRITVINDHPKKIGCIHFGGEHHVPRLILSAQKHDPSILAAMNIKSTPAIIQACQNSGLSIIKIDRTKEPKEEARIEGKSMNWIIEEAARVNDGKIPDLIADEGSKGKEAMVRIFGNSAINVVEKAFQILKKTE